MPSIPVVLLLAAICQPQEPKPATTATLTIAGQVVDLRGEGVPVAEVWIADPSDGTKDVARTVADGEGYFRMPRVPTGKTWQVRASAEGLAVGSEYVRSGEIARVEVHDGTTVRGVLRDADGKPVVDTVVSSAPAGRALPRIAVTTKTDDKGHFELPKVPLGLAQMTAWIPGQGLAELRHRVTGDDEVELKASEEATTSFDITIDGLPETDAPDVTLAWLPYRRGSLTRLPPPYATPIIEDGVWHADSVPNWRYIIRLRADGYAFQPDRVTLRVGSGPHQLGFVATEIGTTELTCRATVTGPGDTPVAGVSFVMRRSNGGARARATATSDEDGKLTFQSPLAAGTQVIVYSTTDAWVIDQDKQDVENDLRDRRDLKNHECRVAPGEVLRLRVVPASTVSGRLLHRGERPAAFVRVELQESSANRWPEWMGFASTTTDRAGNFRFRRLHHSPGEVRLLVEGAAGTATSEPFTIADVGSRAVIAPIELAPPAAIAGVVHDGDGKPAPGVAIWLQDWDMQRGRQRSGSVTEVITDKQGRYRFLGVPIGGAWLEFVSDERFRKNVKAVEPFEVEAGQTYTFELEFGDS